MAEPATHFADATTPTPPASALIGLILATHHREARALLAKAAALAPGVAAAAAEQDPRLPRLLDTFGLLRDEMLAHLNREESILFPIVQEVEADPTSGEAEVGAMLHPVVCMKREHGFIDELLLGCRQLTDNYTPPAWASAAHRELLATLAAFEVDTREHVRKEDGDLFPLIMALAPPVR